MQAVSCVKKTWEIVVSLFFSSDQKCVGLRAVAASRGFDCDERDETPMEAKLYAIITSMAT